MIKMELIIIFFALSYLFYLIYEQYEGKQNREKLIHVIHVNGTRGKSSTTRLIDAALRGGDYKVFSKTTGSSPMTIDVNGNENLIKRRGRANIKEQFAIMRQAVKEGADILVIECMAVRPELQYLAQNKILRADISIVTNARRDHLEEMGPTLKDVAVSLGKVMPKRGKFITGEEKFIDLYREIGKENGSQVILAERYENPNEIDFPDNVGIALEVCKLLGIHRDLGISRMKNYKKDPGVLTTYRFKNSNNKEIYFINGFAINDSDSIEIIYNHIRTLAYTRGKDFILLINNRMDRGNRARQHIEMIDKLTFDQVWIVGSYKKFMKTNLIKRGIKEDKINIEIKDIVQDMNSLENHSIVFGIGNLVGNGQRIINQIKEIGEEYV